MDSNMDQIAEKAKNELISISECLKLKENNNKTTKIARWDEKDICLFSMPAPTTRKKPEIRSRSNYGKRKENFSQIYQVSERALAEKQIISPNIINFALPDYKTSKPANCNNFFFRGFTNRVERIIAPTVILRPIYKKSQVFRGKENIFSC